ncbi:S-adenosyl-L-methionine-dependent methyltransferase [Obba rivulosa]|uniref:type I protein arginine methyltransferase n=1 Tax=Obba rivulosa TaxID=1052685 RepID=A0A8E2DLJ1_9APHY|nr:S-adenosyl-L-methionine-dependent methyltransferase [Obba rivulosa]
MSLRLSAHHLKAESIPDEDERSSSSQDEDDDQNWDDWVSDSADKRPCKSLFEDKTFPSVSDALNHDKTHHGFDLEAIFTRLSLDPYQRIRLVNWIRKQKPSIDQLSSLKGDEAFLSADEYLIPTVEDDPLLQVQLSGDWSDESDDELPEAADLPGAVRRVCVLEKRLQKAQQALSDYRAFVGDRLNLAGLADSLREEGSSGQDGTSRRDDDTHYFESYGENDIHAIMIQDKVRTATYAQYIMSTPEVFRDAIVLDVGCGTGILSLFAARAGAKRVLAVDASPIAEKAEQIVKANGLDDVITVIHGKVEDIKLPDGIAHVDVIVSEWMGYALLYESMLDSVLRARDRFLKPEGGIMAPSQCKMVLGLSEVSELFKERIGWWDDVYGFDLSVMGKDVYDEAIVDIVGTETMLSDRCVIKDLYVPDLAPKQLDFTSPFTLVSTAERRTKIHALVLYFDVFFTSTGESVPPETRAYVVREGDPILAEVWPLGGRPHPTRRMSTTDHLKGRPKVTSFSTGPDSVPTHWKQTIFLLRDPITVTEGTVVQGTFTCRKSDENSRELDVEIHYVVKESADQEPEGEAVVQIFKVR